MSYAWLSHFATRGAMFAHGRDQRHLFRPTGCPQRLVASRIAGGLGRLADVNQPPESCLLPVRVLDWLQFGTTWRVIIRYSCNEVPMWVPRRPRCPHSGL